MYSCRHSWNRLAESILWMRITAKHHTSWIAAASRWLCVHELYGADGNDNSKGSLVLWQWFADGMYEFENRICSFGRGVCFLPWWQLLWRTNHLLSTESSDVERDGVYACCDWCTSLYAAHSLPGWARWYGKDAYSWRYAGWTADL